MFAQSSNKKKLLISLLPLTLLCQSVYADFGVMPAFTAAHGIALQTPYNSASALQDSNVCYSPFPIMPTRELSFIGFDDLEKVEKKNNGANGGEHAGVYKSSGKTPVQETYYVKDPQLTGYFLNEYLASLFLQEFYPQGSAVVKLMKDLPSYVASKAIKGFVPFQDLDRLRVSVPLQSSIDLCVVRNIIGLPDIHDGNAGIAIDDSGAQIDAGVDYDGSFNFFSNLKRALSCRGVTNDLSEEDLVSAYKSFIEKYRRNFFEQSFANIENFLENHLSNFDRGKFEESKKRLLQNYEELKGYLIAQFYTHDDIKYLYDRGLLKPEQVTASVLKYLDLERLKFLHELGLLKPEHITTEDVFSWDNIEKLKFLHELGLLKPEHVTEWAIVLTDLKKLKFLHELGLLKPEHVTEYVVRVVDPGKLDFLNELGLLKPEHVTERLVDFTTLANIKFLHKIGFLKPEHVTESVVKYASFEKLKFFGALGLLKPEHVTESVVKHASFEELKFFHKLGFLTPEHVTEEVLKYADLEKVNFFREAGLIKEGPSHNILLILHYLAKFLPW